MKTNEGTARRALIAALLDAKAITQDDLSAAVWGMSDMTATPGRRLLEVIREFVADMVEASCKDAPDGCRSRGLKA